MPHMVHLAICHRKRQFFLRSLETGKEFYPFLVSRTYSETWLEGDEGDYSDEGGYIFRDKPMSLGEVLEELSSCDQLSSCPVSATRCHGVWATQCDADKENDCDNREESVHIRDRNGKELRSLSLFRIYRLAGLTR